MFDIFNRRKIKSLEATIKVYELLFKQKDLKIEALTEMREELYEEFERQNEIIRDLRWQIEFVEPKPIGVRLKNCHIMLDEKQHMIDKLRRQLKKCKSKSGNKS